MDDFDTFMFIASVGLGAALMLFFLSFTTVIPQGTAEFVCESHGLELIDFEVQNPSFSKVECGNKKPELQYDNYKVFTK